MSIRPARPEWAVEIERLRGKLKLSQAALAKLLNVSAMAPSRWERGINEPTGEIYIQLGKLIGPPQCWAFWRRAGLERQDVLKVMAQPMVEKSGERPALVQLPIVKVSWPGRMQGEVVALDQVSDHIAVPRTWCPHPEQTVCIRVEDDAMAPELREDYVAAFDLAVHRPKDLIQQIVAVKVQDDLLIRRLESRPDGFMLAANDAGSPSIPLTRAAALLGKMLWWIGCPQEAKARKAASGSAPFSSR